MPKLVSIHAESTGVTGGLRYVPFGRAQGGTRSHVSGKLLGPLVLAENDFFQRTGGGQGLQPVFCIVCQASIALCRSNRRWLIGTGERGGIQLKVRTSSHCAWTVAMEGLK